MPSVSQQSHAAGVDEFISGVLSSLRVVGQV
jgi:hypothetical protein